MEEPEGISVEKNHARVYDQALRWLARRPYGEEELRQRLRERTGAPPEVVEQALDRCRELGYLDDRAFAETMVRGRLLRDGWGPWRVRAELTQRGVAAPLVEAALAMVLVDNDESTLARRALGGQRAQAATLSPKERRKQGEFLARRGFDWEVIRRLLGEEMD